MAPSAASSTYQDVYTANDLILPSTAKEVDVTTTDPLQQDNDDHPSLQSLASDDDPQTDEEEQNEEDDDDIIISTIEKTDDENEEEDEEGEDDDDEDDDEEEEEADERPDAKDSAPRSQLRGGNGYNDDDHQEGEDDAEEDQDAQASSNLNRTHLQAYNLSMIDQRVFIQKVAGKGRCLFARSAMKPGDIIFVEQPVLAALPSINEELWNTLRTLNEEEHFALPPVWHLAAITSLTKLDLAGQRAVQQKFVPDPNEAPSRDVERVLEVTSLALDPVKYQRALNAWRFNGFGHHGDNDGLILYDRISNMAHSCSSSATWHYGDSDNFVLRSRQNIPAGGEITISYIGDEDLLKPTHIRRGKLASWQFTCNCARCADPVDKCRGFRCPDCGIGTVFMKNEIVQQAGGEEEYYTTAQPCTVCELAFDADQIRRYETFEDAYIARLEETSKDYLSDAELVYQEAGRVFTQHHVMYELDTILYEGYKEQERYQAAAAHLQKRIDYASSVCPKATFTVAGMYEDLGDLLFSAVGDIGSLNGYYRNTIARSYESSFNALILLCGADHDYTLAAHGKFSQIINSRPSDSS